MFEMSQLHGFSAKSVVFVACVRLLVPAVASAQSPGMGAVLGDETTTGQDRSSNPVGRINEGFEQWSAAIIGLSGARWVGERVPVPGRVERPELPVRVDSLFAPVSVHAPEDLETARVAIALGALTSAHRAFAEMSWPVPRTDGGLGDTPGFDLYLVPGAPPSEASYDGQARWRYLDTAESHARVAADLGIADLEVCVTDAFARAMLLAIDPASAASWRAVTAEALTRRLLGRSCESLAEQAQAEPWRTLVSHRDELEVPVDHGGAALFLEALGARHDVRPGQFVRDLWELNAQRTWQGEEFRGAPDGWLSLQALVRGAGDTMSARVEEFAVQRYFAGHGPQQAARGGLGDVAPVPMTFETTWAELPKGMPSTAAGEHPFVVEPFGSVYARVEVTGAEPDARLRVWLRGEFGVSWVLTASTVDARGVELSRLSATSRRGTPRAYLPVELDERTRAVVVIATNLGMEGNAEWPNPMPNADVPGGFERAVRLSFDKRGANEN